MRLGRVRLLFTDAGHQDGTILRYASGKLTRGERCFTVRTSDDMEDDFSLQEVEDGILAFAAHLNCNLRDGHLRVLRYNGQHEAFEPIDGADDVAAANIYASYLPYIKTTVDGVAAWHRDVQLGPHLQSYEESLRWLGQLDGDTNAPKIDLTIGARHAALLATCQHWSKRLQNQWARCFELTCAVLDAMPPKSAPHRRLAALLDLLPFLLLRRDDGQSQKHMETSIRQRCTKFLGVTLS